MWPELEKWQGQAVVIDTKSSYLYIGKLVGESENFLELDAADVHDHNEYSKSKELYVMESLQHGVKTNRHKVLVVKKEIISLSLLSDVIEY